MYYLVSAWEIILQILSVVGRGFLILLACGVAGTMLFFIELIVSFSLPKEVVNKEWFSTLVIISCIVAGIVVAILCGKALF